MTNGGEVPEATKLEAARILFEATLRQWNERRSFEWKALFGFIAFMAGIGSVIAGGALASLDSCCKIVLTLAILLVSLAVALYLYRVDKRDEEERPRIDALNEFFATTSGCRGAVYKDAARRMETDWALVPQLLFIFAVALSLVVLLWVLPAN